MSDGRLDRLLTVEARRRNAKRPFPMNARPPGRCAGHTQPVREEAGGARTPAGFLLHPGRTGVRACRREGEWTCIDQIRKRHHGAATWLVLATWRDRPSAPATCGGECMGFAALSCRLRLKESALRYNFKCLPDPESGCARTSRLRRANPAPWGSETKSNENNGLKIHRHRNIGETGSRNRALTRV